MSGKYVVFDGMDGSGKGTQIKMLQERFGERVVFTYEPGGTPFADKIRALVRNDPLAKESTPLNNFLLFWAAREELVEKVVMPALTEGRHVFSDRGYSSTYAYQICGEECRDLRRPFLLLREEVFDKGPRYRPDLHVVYDLPAAVARERVMRDSTRERNHFDDRPLAYYERVREGFRKFAKEQEVVRFVDANQSPEAMHEETLEILREHKIY